MNCLSRTIYFHSFRIMVLIMFPLLMSAQIISTVAGTTTAGFSGDNGPATSARFDNVASIAMGPNNTLYIADQRNNRIRRVDLITGLVKTIAGTGTGGFSGDGGPALSARINSPGDLVVDASGNVYFADELNYRVRMINTSGVINTIIGGGVPVYGGNTTAATSVAIFIPTALTLGLNNDLFVSLYPSAYIVRLNLSTGVMQRYAGNGNNVFSGDGGPAVNASFNNPQGLCMTAAGELYVADAFNNRIRKVGADHVVTTIAGDGMAEFSGDGGDALKASMYAPSGVTVDASGNILIADRYNHRIRKVDAATNVITTVAGSGTRGFGGDGFDASSFCVNLAEPNEIRFDATGNYYIADFANHRVRMVGTQAGTPPPTPTVTITASATQICPNSRVDFTSVTTNTTGVIQYQWQVDGQDAGTNSPQFSSTDLKNGQVVTCRITVQSPCGGNATVTSNPIQISISFAVTPSIIVTTAAAVVCQGSPVTFTATAVFPGGSPVYQWQVNGVNEGTNNTSFTSGNLPDGAVVRCLLTTTGLCSGSVTVASAPVTISVRPVVTPAITISSGATTTCVGSAVSFQSVVNTGNIPVTYDWLVNGISTGNATASFSSTTLRDGDQVSASISLDPSYTCATVTSVTSSPVTVHIINADPASVSISSSANDFCFGGKATITAVAANAGLAPQYSWSVNGQSLPGVTDDQIQRVFNQGDEIVATLIPGAAACGGSSLLSNVITMRVNPLPVIRPELDEIFITPGAQAVLKTTTSADVAAYSWSPRNLLVSPDVLSPQTISLSQNTIFTLEAETDKGCKASAQVDVKIYSNLLIPSVFTPNGDGVNDLFRIPDGIGITLEEFAVYNRWGMKVYSTKMGSAGWNGMIKSERAPAGIYVYMISGLQGQKKVFLRGTVTLIR